VLNLGTYREQVRRAAALRPGDRVVDVGCGTGEVASVVGPSCRYLGLDLSSANVEHARASYGAPHRTFTVLDITGDPLPDGPFDVGFMISVLHHMDEGTADAVLSHLARQVTRRIVVLDLLAVEGNPVQRFFVSLDQGHHVRPLWEQKRLLERHVDVVGGEVFATRSGSATYTLFTCEPRRPGPAGAA
jgi:ubiquinone/menaquinone biosynthesis C-methylase UbiE